MWLTEDPWPPAIVLLIAAVILGLVWSRNQRVLFLGLAVACVALIGAAFLIDQFVVTPAEQVEQKIDAVRDAVIRDDIKATLAFLTPTAIAEKAAIAAAMSAGRVQPDARITDVDVEVKANDTLAVSHFRANGTFTGNGVIVGGDHHFATRWRVSWRKEAGDWKIFAVERLNPVTGDTVGMLEAD